jgi:hypothetical protein
MHLRKAFLWSMVFSLGFAAFLGVIGIVFDHLGATAEKILVTSLIIGGTSMASLACAFAIEQRRVVPVGWIGIGSSGVAALVGLTIAWGNPVAMEDELVKLGAIATVVAIWASHMGLLMLPRIDRSAWRIVRVMTLVTAGTLAIVIIGVILAEDLDKWVAKLMGVLSILCSCGTVVTPILALLDRLRRRQAPETFDRRIAVRLACPRCGAEGVVETGGARCEGCSLRIEVRVDEPRCACGYLLYRLASASCPECGRPVDPRDRWVSPVSTTGESAAQ